MQPQSKTRRRPVAALSALAGAVMMLCAYGGVQAQAARASFLEFEAKELLLGDLNGGGPLGGSAVRSIASGPVLLGFEGPSQYNAASFNRSFIPPDTMGAIGASQYMAVTNGVYGVYSRAGAALSVQSDVAFWAAAGKTDANGDSRILYNSDVNRWMVISFAASVANIQIAVSDTSNALGPWKSTEFSGFAGGTADYPTLAMDKSSVYIGTNNFKVGCNPGSPSSNSFCGVSLNIIPLNSVFAAAPTVTNMKQFVTPYTYTASEPDRGYAIQGVNGNTSATTGKIVATSLLAFDNIAYNVSGLSAASSAGATQGAVSYLGLAPFTDPGAARQPATITANQRITDTLDSRISSNVYETQGKIITVQTVDSGSDHASVRYTVTDATSNAILSQGEIGSSSFDYFQGSVAANAGGRVVIGYNRSGATTADLHGDGLADGNVSFMARTYVLNAAGVLVATSGELLLKAGLTSDYHNGAIDGDTATGRQRWGDYSQVSVDPTDSNKFWAIGEFAREYNNAAGGHPGGTGGSRWGTYIAEISAVPEPSTYGMMALGMAVVGGMVMRRRRNT